MTIKRIWFYVAMAVLLLSCGRNTGQQQEDVAMFERMDSLTNACNYSEALLVGDSLLARLENANDSLRSEVLSLMGIASFRLGNMTDAVRYQQECFDIDRKTSDADLLSSDLNQLAAFSLQAGRHELAKDYILEAIRTEKPLKRNEVLAIRYGLASEIFLKLEDYRQAEEYARKALDVDCKAKRQDKVGIRLSQLAAVYLAQGQKLDEAYDILDEAVGLLEDAENKNSLSIVYCQLGELALLKHTAAGNHFNKALQLTAETGNKFIEKRALQGLFQTLKKENPSQAVACLERYTTLNDSLSSAEAVSSLNALKVQYETRELQLDNERLSAENSRKQLLIIMLGILVVSLVAIATLLRHSRLSKVRLMRHMENIRTNFFTNITHEFRTPITVILGLSESIAEGKMQGDELQKAARVIATQGNGLLDLVNQLAR